MARKSKKLTEPQAQSVPTELERWQYRINQARRLREQWEQDYQVEDCERFFLGEQGPRSRGKSKDLVFNHFRATVRTMKPSLFYTNPKFYVRPKRGLLAGAQDTNAAVGEGVLQAIGEQDQNLKRAASLALMQSFFRIGVLKTCYDPTLVSNPRAGEPIYQEGPDGMTMRDEMGQPVPQLDPFTGEPVVEPEEILSDEVYRYEYVDARNMLLPDEGPDRARWTWIGEEITVSLEDAKADTRFPKEVRERLESNVQKADSRKTTRSTVTTPEPDQGFRYVEIWDLKGRTHKIYAEGQTDQHWLLDEPLPPGVEGHPYGLLIMGDPILGPDPSPWPVPFTRSWLDVQREYNINRKQVQNAAKRAARKIYYDNSTFETEDELSKAASPDDMAFVKLNDTSRPPLMVPEPPLSSDVYQAVSQNMLDWRIITGQTGARLSGGSDANTATEASFVERAANLKDADSQDLVNDWLTEAGKKMFQLVKKTLTLEVWIKLRSLSDEEFVRYLSQRLQIPAPVLLQIEQQIPGFRDMLKERVGPEQWRTVSREDLEFEADVEVVPGSAKPRSLEAEKRAFMEFWTMVSSAPQLAMSRAWLEEAARMYDGLLTKQVIDEVHAMAMQWVMMNATQAGHGPEQAGKTQGGSKGQTSPEANGAKASTAGQPDMGALMAGIMGGLG